MTDETNDNDNNTNEPTIKHLYKADNIPVHTPYYSGEMFVITKRGVKGGIIATIIGTVGFTATLFGVQFIMKRVISNAPPLSPAYTKTVADLLNMVDPTPVKIIVTGLILFFINVMMFSQIDIQTRMEKLWKKYNSKTWDELLGGLKAKGYTYPWWNDAGFMEESK